MHGPYNIKSFIVYVLVKFCTVSLEQKAFSVSDFVQCTWHVAPAEFQPLNRKWLTVIKLMVPLVQVYRTQLPRGLRRRSTVACLL
jgi:hypothetical protein